MDIEQAETITTAFPLDLRDGSPGHVARVRREIAAMQYEDDHKLAVAADRLLDDLNAGSTPSRFQHVVAPEYGLPPNDEAYQRSHEDDEGDAFGVAERCDRFEQE